MPGAVCVLSLRPWERGADSQSQRRGAVARWLQLVRACARTLRWLAGPASRPRPLGLAHAVGDPCASGSVKDALCGPLRTSLCIETRSALSQAIDPGCAVECRIALGASGLGTRSALVIVAAGVESRVSSRPARFCGSRRLRRVGGCVGGFKYATRVRSEASAERPLRASR